MGKLQEYDALTALEKNDKNIYRVDKYVSGDEGVSGVYETKRVTEGELRDIVNRKDLPDLLVSNHNYVEEKTERFNIPKWEYTASTITVGFGGDYSTISDAIINVDDGGTIKLLDGVYEVESEAGGFLFIDSLKSFRITGNAADISTTKITCYTEPAHSIRIRDANKITFENITFEIKKGITVNPSIYNIPTEVIFNNCKIENVNIDSIPSALIYCAGNRVFDGLLTFDNCTMISNKNSESNVLNNSGFTDSKADLYEFPIVFNKCNFKNGRLHIIQSVDVKIYNTYFESDIDRVMFFSGVDTSPVIYSKIKIDVRSCFFKKPQTFYSTAFLMGRGVNFLNLENNIFESEAFEFILGTGTGTCFAIKSIAENKGDVNVCGNIFIGARPLYLKGASGCIVNNNSIISKYQDSTGVLLGGYGLELAAATEDVDLISVDNEFKKNTLFSVKQSLAIHSIATQSREDILQKNIFEGNKYISKNNYFYENVLFNDRFDIAINDVTSSFERIE